MAAPAGGRRAHDRARRRRHRADPHPDGVLDRDRIRRCGAHLVGTALRPQGAISRASRRAPSCAANASFGLCIVLLKEFVSHCASRGSTFPACPSASVSGRSSSSSACSCSCSEPRGRRPWHAASATGVKEMKDAVTEMHPRSILDPKDEPAEAPQRQLATSVRSRRLRRCALLPRRPRSLHRPRREARGRAACGLMDVVSYERSSRSRPRTARRSVNTSTRLRSRSPRRRSSRGRRRCATTTRSARRSTSSSPAAGRWSSTARRARSAEGDAILIPPGAWHELRAGADGARLLCCCVPPYTHDDTYFA